MGLSVYLPIKSLNYLRKDPIKDFKSKTKTVSLLLAGFVVREKASGQVGISGHGRSSGKDGLNRGLYDCVEGGHDGL
jgi:hypothetical protein